MSRGSFEAGLDALGEFESGRPSGDPEQYRVQNTLGFTGKYQFGEALLIDLGYYQADTYYGNGADTNLWQGTWTEKAQAFGVNSIEDFRNSPEIQETAIRDAFKFNWDIIETVLGNAGKTVDDYIGQTITFNDGGTQKSVTITTFGILAGAHLRGPYGVANLLLNGEVSFDEYGTSILRYVDEYAGYDVPTDITGGVIIDPPTDPPTTPTDPIDPIVVTDTVEGTDGVEDTFSFTWNWGQNTVIKNFNPTEDTVDLQNFWLPNSQQVSIIDDSQGNVVIDLREVNNQTITLEGISKSQLTASNFLGLPDANTVLNINNLSIFSDDLDNNAEEIILEIVSDSNDEDNITGEEFDDLVNGDTGKDELLGNVGKDIFQFGSDLLDGIENVDLITDFAEGDTFDFSDYLAVGGEISFYLGEGELLVELNQEDLIIVQGDIFAAEQSLMDITNSFSE